MLYSLHDQRPKIDKSDWGAGNRYLIWWKKISGFSACNLFCTQWFRFTNGSGMNVNKILNNEINCL